MRNLVERVIYIVVLTVWAVFFGVESLRLGRSAQGLDGLTEKLDVQAGRISKLSAQIVSALKQTHDLSTDLTFLQGLFNFLPESEGFLRTQQALLQDVQVLRTKIGNRLKGRLHVLIDTKTNKLFVKEGVKLLWQADCSVGRGGILSDKRTGRRWEFVTPRGKFRVIGKIEKPVWVKPDWAFVETGETPPPPGDPKRRAQGELGAYVLSLGDGYLIHGTKNEELLGTAVSHGCVRLGATNLELLYQQVPVGTDVYIY